MNLFRFLDLFIFILYFFINFHSFLDTEQWIDETTEQKTKTLFSLLYSNGWTFCLIPCIRFCRLLLVTVLEYFVLFFAKCFSLFVCFILFLRGFAIATVVLSIVLSFREFGGSQSCGTNLMLFSEYHVSFGLNRFGFCLIIVSTALRSNFKIAFCFPRNLGFR